ncbi:transporter [candidate division WOR-3 bacterium]|nr:transporter [candidate division WOR-3 bacterium]
MKRLTVVMFLLLATAGSVMATSFLGRSATLNKQYQFFGWANFGYNQTAVSYNWQSGKYEAPEGFLATQTVACDLTLAFGLTCDFDIDVVVPVAMKQKDTLKSSGLGDLMVYGRYGILQDPEKPLKVALLLGANLPTASKTANPALGDRTTDVAFGLSMNTKKYGRFLGYIRAAYWFNGRTPDAGDDTKVGDMFEYLLCGDYAVSKTLTPELALSGYIRDQTVWGGTWKPQSQGSLHLVSLLLWWKPTATLSIRPKVSVPLTFISEGGTIANWYGGLDVWFSVP